MRSAQLTDAYLEEELASPELPDYRLAECHEYR
jgi:hypothetical protein